MKIPNMTNQVQASSGHRLDNIRNELFHALDETRAVWLVQTITTTNASHKLLAVHAPLKPPNESSLTSPPPKKKLKHTTFFHQRHIQPKKNNTTTPSQQITEWPVELQVKCLTGFRRSGGHCDGGSVASLRRCKGNLENQQCREAAKHVSPTSLDTSYMNFSVLVSQGKTFLQIINQLNWFDHKMMQKEGQVALVACLL